MSAKPSISVVIPFRDAAPWINEALGSIAVQTLQDFEVVLVDDNSADGSAEICSRWCRADHRFRLESSAGRGLVDALNTGLELSAGKWIARFDADDVSMPDRLAEQILLAEKLGSRSVISCMVRSFPEQAVSDGYRNYENWINSLISHDDIEKGIFIESPIPHPSAFFSREEVLREGGYRDSGLPEDYELWLRLWSRGFRFERVPAVLLGWRERRDRLSRVSPVYALTRFYKLKAEYLRHAPAAAEGKLLVAGTGQSARRLSGCLLDEGFEIVAFMDPAPGKGRELRGIPVIGPNELERYPDTVVVVASRAPGARSEIVRFLESTGRTNWKDFIVCA